MLTALIGRIVIILFGVLHPSYKTYKAINRKDPKEVVILGMYWVVFSIFTTVELATDIFLAWIPFYYELKILFVIWLVTPATSGYSIIYRKLIHPELSKREHEIDEYITTATEKGYTKFMEFGAKGLNYAAKTVLSTAMMGQDILADHISRRSASMNDLRPVQQRGAILGSGDHRSNSPEEDPFALTWMNPQDSVGRRWRPIQQGLLEEPSESSPDDPNNNHTNSSDEATQNPTKVKSGRPERRNTNVVQSYLQMISTSQPVTKTHTYSMSFTMPPSPLGSPKNSSSPRRGKPPAPLPQHQPRCINN